MPQPTTNNLEGWEDSYPLNTFSSKVTEELIEFIINLRKHDEEELIKMLPPDEKDFDRDYVLGDVKQLIKEYYEK